MQNVDFLFFQEPNVHFLCRHIESFSLLLLFLVKLEWHSKRLYLEVKQNIETPEMLDLKL